MNAVIEYGRPLVDDPDRVGTVRQLGVDETTYLSTTCAPPTIYATGLGAPRKGSTCVWSA